MIRFLHIVAEAADRRDPTARRVAVKRALDYDPSPSGAPAYGCRWQTRAGVERVLCIDLCADSASIAGRIPAQVRARDRLCEECAGRVEAGRSRKEHWGAAHLGLFSSTSTPPACRSRSYDRESAAPDRIAPGSAGCPHSSSPRNLIRERRSASGGEWHHPATVSSSSSCCFW